MTLSTFDQFKMMSVEGAHELSSEELRALQLTLCGILDDMISVCEEEGLDWALGGGSALGAIRHEGFIPWDDDLDFNLPRDAWHRFSLTFGKRFGDKYVIYEPGNPRNYPLAFPRIRLRGTSVITREDLLYPELEKGAFVDVFLLENTYDCLPLRLLHGFGSLVLGFLYSCRKCFSERKLLAQWGMTGGALRLKLVIGTFLFPVPLGCLTNIWHRWNGICRNGRSRFVTFPVGRRHFFGELAERQSMCGKRQCRFEGRKVRCVQGLEAYMTRLYGPNYMTLPPEEKRERHVVFPPFSL